MTRDLSRIDFLCRLSTVSFLTTTYHNTDRNAKVMCCYRYGEGLRHIGGPVLGRPLHVRLRYITVFPNLRSLLLFKFAVKIYLLSFISFFALLYRVHCRLVLLHIFSYKPFKKMRFLHLSGAVRSATVTAMLVTSILAFPQSPRYRYEEPPAFFAINGRPNEVNLAPGMAGKQIFMHRKDNYHAKYVSGPMDFGFYFWSDSDNHFVSSVVDAANPELKAPPTVPVSSSSSSSTSSDVSPPVLFPDSKEVFF